MPHGRTEAAAARERELEKAKRATQKRYHELITQVGRGLLGRLAGDAHRISRVYACVL